MCLFSYRLFVLKDDFAVSVGLNEFDDFVDCLSFKSYGYRWKISSTFFHFQISGANWARPNGRHEKDDKNGELKFHRENFLRYTGLMTIDYKSF